MGNIKKCIEIYKLYQNRHLHIAKEKYNQSIQIFSKGALKMRPSFAYGPSPMIVGVIRQRTARDAIAEIKNGEARGARGFDLHLDALDEEFRNVESIKQIVDSTDKPVLALTYNNGYYKCLDMDEDERTALLMTAVDAGVSAVDLQGYSFDLDAKVGFVDFDHIPEGMEFLSEKKPREVALKPEVIKKQQDFIKVCHDKGAEVLISMHFAVHLSFEELKAIATFAHDVKGADIVKLVTPCTNEAELAECISSTILLKRDLPFPFCYHANGKMGYKSRMICPMLGSHVMFCNVDYGYSSNIEQLHLESMTEAYRRMGTL